MKKLFLLLAICGVMVACGDAKQSGRKVSVVVTDNTITVNGVSLNMIWVEGGTFKMGSNDGYSGARPAHDVTLDGYCIAETEVTQELWKAVMGGYDRWDDDWGKGPNYPAYFVSYYEAIDFCEKLNELTYNKYNFRLPTEAEWEYAARGGNKSHGYEYSGSNNIDGVAWYDDNSGYIAHPVKSKKCNELGLYDMSGNLWEWCSDRYSSSYYSHSPSKNPTGPNHGDYRVLRGGSWNYYKWDCQVTYRHNYDPDHGFDSGGFRIVSSSLSL